MQVPHLPVHELPHRLVRNGPGAVPGIKDRGILLQFHSRIRNEVNIFFRIGPVLFHHMEPAHDNIRRSSEQFFIPVQNIQDTMMRTAAEQHRFLSLPDHQTLLMSEILLHRSLLFLFFERRIRRGKRPLRADCRKQCQFLIDPVNSAVGGKEMHLFQITNLRSQPDIMRLPAFRHGIELPKRRVLNPDLRPRIDPCKRQDAAAVIIMPVTQHDGIDLRQIHAQLLRVFQQQIRSPGIHQQLVFVRLHIQTKAMLRTTAGMAFCILHQSDDLHFCLPFPSKAAISSFQYNTACHQNQSIVPFSALHPENNRRRHSR